MDKLQEITDYISNMKIKKTFFFVFDREDVYVKFSAVTEMFQKYIEELQDKQREQIAGYEQRVSSAEMLIAELNKKIGSLSAEQKNADQEKEKMRTVYKEYCSNILQQYSDSLRALSTEFTQILENVSSLQQNIINIESMDIFELEAEDQPALPEGEEAKEAADEVAEEVEETEEK